VVDRIDPQEKQSHQLALYRVLEDSGVTAEPWVMGEEEFEETKTVIGSPAFPAWNEGVTLYESS
jgi:hypothetical protein